jgi:hypothetical protein
MCHTEVEGVKQPLVEKNDRRTAADPYDNIEDRVHREPRLLSLLSMRIDSREDWPVARTGHLARDARLLFSRHCELSDLEGGCR